MALTQQCEDCGQFNILVVGTKRCNACLVKTNKKPSNPKDRAATNRLDLSLFPASARAYGALGMTEGDCKYGGFNYRIAGVQASTYYAACGRHMDKWFNGEWADPKTGVPHLASALSCIAVIIDAVECKKLNDDRPPNCNMGKLFEEMEARVAALHQLFPNGPARYTNYKYGPEVDGLPCTCGAGYDPDCQAEEHHK